MSTFASVSLTDDLRDAVRGTVTVPSDPDYDSARSPFHLGADQRPAAVVEVADADDVVAAIRVARAYGLSATAQATGHGATGHGGDTVLLRTTAMRGIEIDASARTARVEPGVRWSELHARTAPLRLHGVCGTAPGVSVVGYCLGGGISSFGRKYGHGSSSIRAVDLVTADGELLHVDDETDPELMRALRGGGGNYGIAASIKFRLHPAPTVTGGLIGHPIERAGEMLRFYRDMAPTVSDDLTVFAALVHAPDGSGMKLAGMIVFHTGTPEEAERELAPFKEWGSPIMVEVGPVPYPAFNTILDHSYPHGLRNYWLSAFTNGIPDGLIDTILERFERVPSPMSGIVIEQFHGAVTRVDPTETAVPHRDAGFNLLIPSVWEDAAGDEANVAWTRDSFAAMKEFFTGGRWLNYLADDQGEDAIHGAYGANYDRLVELKGRYDPENVFRANHNIAP